MDKLEMAANGYEIKSYNMKNYKIEIEIKGSAFTHLVYKQVDDIMRTATDKEDAVKRFNNELWDCKSGYGGSHIWISNKNNEREVVIYL